MGRKVKTFYDKHEPIDIKWGSILRYLRNRKKLTLRDVEAEAGFTNAYISQLENGHEPVKQPVLTILLRIYESSMVEFVNLLYAPVIPQLPAKKHNKT